MPDLLNLDLTTLEQLLQVEPVDQEAELHEIREYVLAHQGVLTAIAHLDTLIEESLTPQAAELRDRWDVTLAQVPYSGSDPRSMTQFQAFLSDLALGMPVPSGPGLQPWSMQQWFRVLADCLHGLDRHWAVLDQGIAVAGNHWGDVVDVTRGFVGKHVEPASDFIAAHRREIEAFFREGIAA